MSATTGRSRGGRDLARRARAASSRRARQASGRLARFALRTGVARWVLDRPLPTGSWGHALHWPLQAAPQGGRVDRVALRVGRVPIWCVVCGRTALVRVVPGNLREGSACSVCGSFNRQRQLAYVICRPFGRAGRIPSLTQLVADHPDLAVYNTEASGAVHAVLRQLHAYRCSEYHGPGYEGGTVVAGVEHQDLHALTHAERSFDLVLSADVMEHVPDPYSAHVEILRVLRPGGRHVFTVPYDPESELDDVRARLRADGSVEHLAPPEYHGDPVRAEGILVFTVFGLEMLVRLRALGFRVRVHRLHAWRLGIFGSNQLVFEAERPR